MGWEVENPLENVAVAAWKYLKILAGRQGFEPRYHGPEPCVLPLDDLPVAGRVRGWTKPQVYRSARRGRNPAGRGLKARMHAITANEFENLEQPWTDRRS